jgi:NAD(P)-dependent dehydrogenase (short-subunit alcohol dehydrogenase family)
VHAINFAFEGRRAVVTGAASGIGGDIAVALLDGGAEVMAVDRDWSDGERLLTAGATLELLDLDGADVAAEAAGLCSRRGPFELLVFAPASAPKPATDGWERLACNMRAAQALSQIFLDALVAQKRTGAAVFVAPPIEASDASIRAARTAVVELARTRARELAPHGVRVNAVEPGRIEPEPGDFGAAIALPRPGTPGDVTAVVLALLSDAIAAYITGATVPVDGGLDFLGLDLAPAAPADQPPYDPAEAAEQHGGLYDDAVAGIETRYELDEVYGAADTFKRIVRAVFNSDPREAHENGLLIDDLEQGLEAKCPRFDPIAVGFPTFALFARYALVSSEYDVADSEDSRRVVLRAG